MMRRSGMYTCRQYHNLFVLAAVVALLLAGLSGCGYKTRPVPPQEIVPKPIVDLRYELNERGVTLYWTYPSETIKGDKLTDISMFNLYRAVVPAESYCDTCPIPFREPVQVPGGAVPSGTLKTATYNATLLRPGHLFFFKVRSQSGWWAESGDSNIISFMWNMPPGIPEEPSAVAGDAKVTLSWKPVSTHMDGTDIQVPVRYQVFRSQGGGPFVALGDLQDGLEYVDATVNNSVNYGYKVQAVTMYEKGQVGGRSSDTVEVAPVDRTPPPVPVDVRAVSTAAGVKVIWSPVKDGGVRGYKVYRRTAGADKAVLAGEVNVHYTLYADSAAPESGEIFYSVTSFDDASPANESKPSAEAMVRR